MLSVGMAANVVVFSLVSALFLRPFPFPDPDRLVDINETAPRWNLDVVGINYPDFHQWRQAAHAFEGLALYDTFSFNVADDRGADRIEGAAVTYDFPAVLGIAPYSAGCSRRTKIGRRGRRSSSSAPRSGASDSAEAPMCSGARSN